MWNFFVKNHHNCQLYEKVLRILYFHILNITKFGQMYLWTITIWATSQNCPKKKKKKKTVYPTHSLIYFARRGILFMDITCFLNTTRNFSKCFMCKVKKLVDHMLYQKIKAHMSKKLSKSPCLPRKSWRRASPIPINC